MKKNKFLITLKKEKKLFILATIVGLLVFMLYLFFLYVPMYKTNTKIFIRNIPKQDVISSYGGGAMIYSESGFSNPLFNLIQVLESDTLANNAYKIILEKYPNDFAQLRVKSQKDWRLKYTKIINSEIKPSTDILKVSLNWPNKNTSQDVLNIIINEFKKANLSIRKTVEIKQREFLDSQLINIGNQLDSIRRKIKDYKIANKAVNMLGESDELTRAKVDLQKEAKILHSKINYYNNKLSNLTSQLGVKDAQGALRASAIGEDPYLIKLSQDLAVSQQKYSQLKAKFTDNYPEVISVKNEMNSLQKNIEKRKKESIGNIKIKRGLYDKPSQDIVLDIARVQAEKTSTAAELSGILRGINELQQQESELPSKVLGLDELQKQERALASAYERIKEKQLESRIKENEIVDNMVILDEPSNPKFIYSFIFMRFIGLIILSLFCAFAISLIKEDIENKWIDSAEIEETTGKKVLGILPWIKATQFVDKDRSLFIHDPESIMGVAYRDIVSNIIRRSYLEEAQAISFISTAVSRGKSVIIPNIAASLVRLNKSIMLIYTDYNKTEELVNTLKLHIPPRKKDLLEVIDRINIHLRISKNLEKDFIAELIEEATWPIILDDSSICHFLFVKQDTNVYDYVATKAFNAIIEFLKDQYEFILIDTPAKPLIFPEFAAISSVSDSIIILSGMSTNREELIKTIERFENKNVKILGIIAREQDSELEKFFIQDAQN